MIASIFIQPLKHQKGPPDSQPHAAFSLSFCNRISDSPFPSWRGGGGGSNNPWKEKKTISSLRFSPFPLLLFLLILPPSSSAFPILQVFWRSDRPLPPSFSLPPLARPVGREAPSPAMRPRPKPQARWWEEKGVWEQDFCMTFTMRSTVGKPV